MRLYPDPSGNLYPSVTSILEATQSTKTKARLQNWNKKQKESTPEGEKTPSELARERGTAVHQMREDFILKGYTSYVSDDVDDYFFKLEPLLKGWDRQGHIWCEKPTILFDYPELTFFDKDLGIERGRLWSEELGYAGCPDDVGYYEGVLTLCDVKTSKRLYQRTTPTIKPSKGIYAKAREDGTESSSQRILNEYNDKLYGYLVYQKTCIQLAAYSLLVKERMGIEPEKWMIMVAPKNPERKVGQRFTLSPSEMKQALSEWNKKLEQFKKEYPLEQFQSA